jgi:hypothetical protein
MGTADTIDPGALAGVMSEMQRDLACPDCKAEVRVTVGVKLFRARVIHDAECLWFQRYQAREVTGRIPCCTVVTHRGPYQHDPEA